MGWSLADPNHQEAPGQIPAPCLFLSYRPFGRAQFAQKIEPESAVPSTSIRTVSFTYLTHRDKKVEDLLLFLGATFVNRIGLAINYDLAGASR
jgi:hypothetical protein